MHRVLALLLAVSACATDDIPRNASGPACEDTLDCPTWACTCGDNSTVVSQRCINRQCQTRDEACPDVCKDVGGWTPRDAGIQICTMDTECSGQLCRCADGQSTTIAACESGHCLSLRACERNCADAGGGWVGQCRTPGQQCAEDVSCCSFRCGPDNACAE